MRWPVVAAGGVLGPASDALRFATSADPNTPPAAAGAVVCQRLITNTVVPTNKRCPSHRVFWGSHSLPVSGPAGHGWGPMSHRAARLRPPALARLAHQKPKHMME
jgi:hypothetical protein